MENFISFVKEWGYLAVFLGAMVEGESVILTACALAALGYLSITKVVALVFFTTLFVDQGLFYLGRYYGPSIFEKFPKLKKNSNKAFILLHKYDKWFILSFRFIYGIRTISPIVIGAAGIDPKRYTYLNLLSAIIWTSISCYSGYHMGDLIESALNNCEIAKQYLIYGGIMIVALLGIYIYKSRKK